MPIIVAASPAKHAILGIRDLTLLCMVQSPAEKHLHPSTISPDPTDALTAPHPVKSYSDKRPRMSCCRNALFVRPPKAYRLKMTRGVQTACPRARPSGSSGGKNTKCSTRLIVLVTAFEDAGIHWRSAYPRHSRPVRHGAAESGLGPGWRAEVAARNRVDMKALDANHAGLLEHRDGDERSVVLKGALECEHGRRAGSPSVVIAQLHVLNRLQGAERSDLLHGLPTVRCVCLLDKIVTQPIVYIGKFPAPRQASHEGRDKGGLLTLKARRETSHDDCEHDDERE